MPGSRFPDYVLPDHTKVPRRLSDLQSDQTMVVVLTRGAFCPKDRRHHHELVRFHPQLMVGFTHVVTITTDDRMAGPLVRSGLRNTTRIAWMSCGGPLSLMVPDPPTGLSARIWIDVPQPLAEGRSVSAIMTAPRRLPRRAGGFSRSHQPCGSGSVATHSTTLNVAGSPACRPHG